MRHFFQSFSLALDGLRMNFTRTALTILGVIIGMAFIVIIMSAGAGIKSLILGQIESFGTNIIETEVKVPNTMKNKNSFSSQMQSGAALASGAMVTTLKLRDMKEIDRLPNVEESYAGIMGQAAVSYRGQLKKITLMGVSPTFIDIDKSKVAQGRFFTQDENNSLAQVAVLGAEIKNDLFGEENPLGKYIRIKGKNFRVIGVMEKRGSFGMMNFDKFIYIPLKTEQKKILGIDYVLFMVHKIKDNSLAPETAAEIRHILRINHHISSPDKDDFRVTTMQQMLSIIGVVTKVITWLLLAIVGVSLAVGGVGIMNTMLVTISERTKEIGLRKAVGASKKDILEEFLIESLLITFTGALLGVIVGIGISYFIAFLAQKKFGLTDWRFIISQESIIIAFVFATFLGLLFGVYPAKKAADLDPIEALTKE